MQPALLPKERLLPFLRDLATGRRLIVPVRDERGTRFGDLPDEAGAALVLDVVNTDESPKEAVFPQWEPLFDLRDLGVAPEVEPVAPEVQPWLLFGVRPCDCRALVLLAQLFEADTPDPYHSIRRRAGIIVALTCVQSGPTCFCTWMGVPLDRPEGADILLTPLDDAYLVEALTEQGQKQLAAAAGHLQEADDKHLQAKQAALEALRAAQPAPPFDASDEASLRSLAEVVMPEEQEPFWQAIARACIGCGVCTLGCPTCTCFDVNDDGIGEHAERYRCWDSCQFKFYALEASGHDPRPEQWERQRNRIGHKLSFSVDRFGQLTCVGCGRCVRQCPVNIDIREAIRHLATAASRAKTP